MDQSLDEYYDNLDRVFSEAASIYDEKIQSNFINAGIREKEVESVVLRYKNGWEVLEIGCGTGEEARKVMESTGCNLTCVDISKGMIDFASSKMKQLGLEDRFRGIRMPASSIGSISGTFQIIYSFNGALNNEPRLLTFFNSLKDVMVIGGFFIVSIRNRFSLGEILADLARFKFSNLFNRFSGEMIVEVVGNGIKSHYFYDSEFMKLVPPCFKLEQMRGLGIFVIPSYYERINSESARSFLKRLETAFTDLPLFKHLGDETLFVFQKVQ